MDIQIYVCRSLQTLQISIHAPTSLYADSIYDVIQNLSLTE